MKTKSSFDKIMHFLVHNSFAFTVVTMFMVHAVLLGIMLISDVKPLVSFNTLSVIIYAFCIILAKFGHILPVYVSIFLEVSVYAAVSSYYIGWDCASSAFLFAIVPIIIYFGCMLFKGNRRWIIVLLLTADFAGYIGQYLRFVDAQPVIEVPELIRMILVIFSNFIMLFAVIFYNVIYIYSSEGELFSLEQKNEQLSADARVDALTELWNRRGFLPMVSSLMDDSHSHHFCVAFCDIDNFKRINDSYGHDCGDEVLRHISKTIKKEMTGCEVCRWGGEEIVILMKDYDMAVARQKMEYVRKLIETTTTVFYNKHIPATITIGVEEYREGHRNPEEVIKAADKRMYYGKQHGKNIVIFEDDEHTAE